MGDEVSTGSGRGRNEREDVLRARQVENGQVHQGSRDVLYHRLGPTVALQKQ